LTALERYRRVFAAPHVTGIWVATTIARLPIGINGLAYVLAIRHETGSYGTAGLAAGAYALTLGLGSPVQGRLIDRLSPARVLPPLVALHAAALVAFVLVLGHAPHWLLVVLAGLSGLGLPPWSSIVRAMWPRLLADEDLVSTAFALDGSLVEIVFIAGPMIVAIAVLVASPQAALLVSAALVLLGTARLVASPAVRAWEPEAHDSRHPFGALKSRGLLTVVLATIPLGFGFGALEIALPAFATAHAHASTAGVLLAAWSLGSACGGLVYGARAWKRQLPDRWIVFSLLAAVALLLPLLAPSVPLLLPLLLPTGALIAPTIASGSQLLGRLAPAGMSTEAYAWGSTAIVVGVSVGNAVAGALVEASGWRLAVAAAAAVALLGAVTARARRETLG
jgi:MFS family permease